MNSKAQSSIEFLLIMMVLLVYLNGIVLPNYLESINAEKDVSAALITENSLIELEHKINLAIKFNDETRIYSDLYLNKGMQLSCNNSQLPTLTFTLVFNREGTEIFTKRLEITLPENISTVNCFDPISGSENGMKRRIKIYYNPNNPPTLTLEVIS